MRPFPGVAVVGVWMTIAAVLHGPAAQAQAGSAPAEPAETPARIGVLFWHDSPNDKLALDGFRRGLEQSGLPHVLEIQNVHEDEASARTLLRKWEATDDCRLVVALGTRAAQLARDELERVPIVYTAVTNPVLTGVAESWQRSGPGIAGNSNWIPAENLLRAFSRAVPKLERLGVIATLDNPVPAAEISGVQEALRLHDDLSISLEIRRVASAADLADAARQLAERVDAVWIPIDILVYENVHLIRKVTDPARVPLLSSSHRGAEAGAILSIVVDYRNLGKNAAAIAVRVLEDEVDPATIPVGRLSGYRTIVNLGRSREIGYRVPLEVVCTADRILR